MTMTVHLDEEASAALTRMAEARGQRPEALAKEAILEMAAEAAAFEEAMAEADRDFEEGRVHSHEFVMEWLKGARARAQEEIARRNKPA